MGKASEVQKFFIEQNYSKMSLGELSEKVGLHPKTVSKYINEHRETLAVATPEPVVEPTPVEQPSQHQTAVSRARSPLLDQMTSKETKGVTVMTKPVSEIGDEAAKKKKSVTAQHAKAIHKIYGN